MAPKRSRAAAATRSQSGGEDTSASTVAMWERPRQRSSTRGLKVRGDNLAAFLDETLDRRGADALGGTGHDGDPRLQSPSEPSARFPFRPGLRRRGRVRAATASRSHPAGHSRARISFSQETPTRVQVPPGRPRDHLRITFSIQKTLAATWVFCDGRYNERRGRASDAPPARRCNGAHRVPRGRGVRHRSPVAERGSRNSGRTK